MLEGPPEARSSRGTTASTVHHTTSVKRIASPEPDDSAARLHYPNPTLERTHVFKAEACRLNGCNLGPVRRDSRRDRREEDFRVQISSRGQIIKHKCEKAEFNLDLVEMSQELRQEIVPSWRDGSGRRRSSTAKMLEKDPPG